MAVTKGSSSLGRLAGGCGFERVVINWTTVAGGVASDNIDLAGEVREIVTIPGTAGVHAIRLRDTSNSDVDYLCGSMTSVSDAAVQFWAPVISDGRDYRAPIVIGDVQFHASDAAGTSDVTGSTIFFLKT